MHTATTNRQTSGQQGMSWAPVTLYDSAIRLVPRRQIYWRCSSNLHRGAVATAMGAVPPSGRGDLKSVC
jgi:hypothetical protein